jgi:glycogen synthase
MIPLETYLLMKILCVASECAPFAKAGGLADAVAGLSK